MGWGALPTLQSGYSCLLSYDQSYTFGGGSGHRSRTAKCPELLPMRYAQGFNRQRRKKGHVWQVRYFSTPLDEAYLWATLPYVERNPVRAGMVRKAERHRWTSAVAHFHLRKDPALTSKKIGGPSLMP